MSSEKLRRMVFAAMFLALSLVLPFLTGQLQQLGNALCPMHVPVLLCGFFCGPLYAFFVGAIAPLLRFFLFGSPVLMPVGAAMCFELATYGAVSGFLYARLPKKKGNIYVSLIAAMLTGRLVWGAARAVMSGLGKSAFGWTAFVSGAFLNAVPGILVQICLIPVLVMTLEKFTYKG